jgi:hypothetical protein
VTNYYRDQQRAFEEIDRLLKEAQKCKVNVTVSGVVYEITRHYPVSPKNVEKQINLFCQVKKVKRVDDELVME